MLKAAFSHGPTLELSLASEALGLVRSLNWQICKGPRGLKEQDESEIEDVKEEIEGISGRKKLRKFSE